MARDDLDRLSKLNPLQLLAIGIGASVLAALAVLFAMGMRRRSMAQSSDPQNPLLYREEVPIQPAVDTVMQADVPQHFTEDVVIPGFTETGMDVEHQDETGGGSPQGV